LTPNLTKNGEKFSGTAKKDSNTKKIEIITHQKEEKIDFLLYWVTIFKILGNKTFFGNN
jgi:hypothetical protein